MAFSIDLGTVLLRWVFSSIVKILEPLYLGEQMTGNGRFIYIN